jgi:alanyl-tRNA synthetase
MKVAKITQTNPTPFTNGMQLGAKVLAKKSSQQISFRTNANNSPKVILLENVHGLPIDLVKPMCEMQQTKKNSTIIQDAPHLLSICKML